MTSHFERYEQRQAQRLGDDIFEPEVVRDLNRIRALIAELHKSTGGDDVPVTAEIINDGDKSQTYRVTAPTRGQSKKAILLEGLRIVKERLEVDQPSTVAAILVNNRPMRAPSFRAAADAYLWVDPLLQRWLGATRSGYYIVWQLPDGSVYHYDIFANKLYRVNEDAQV